MVKSRQGAERRVDEKERLPRFPHHHLPITPHQPDASSRPTRQNDAFSPSLNNAPLVAWPRMASPSRAGDHPSPIIPHPRCVKRGARDAKGKAQRVKERSKARCAVRVISKAKRSLSMSAKTNPRVVSLHLSTLSIMQDRV